MNKAVFTVFFCGGIVKKHEIIGLLIILIISTVYSFTLPETSLNEIESDPQVKIIVEGKYMKLSYLILHQQSKMYLKH